MKFGVTDVEHRLPHTKPAVSSKQRGNQQEDSNPTAWEERIARAKKRTTARRTSQQAEEPDASSEKAEAAYLQWLAQRTARIEQLRARIETGTYHIDSRTLARDIIRGMPVGNEA